MANLISDGEWLEIRSALQDVMDTFFTHPIVLKLRRKRSLAKFHENRKDDLVEQLYNVNCLIVEESKDENKSQVDQFPKGFLNNSQGYIYFNYKYMKEHSPSFVDAAGRVLIVPNKDSVILLGVELSIIGVNLVGPTQSDFQLIKVQWKKQLPNLNDLPGTGPEEGIFDGTFDETYQ